MRDWLAFKLMLAARRLTTMGDVDDMLDRALRIQRWAAYGQCDHMKSRCDKCR